MRRKNVTVWLPLWGFGLLGLALASGCGIQVHGGPQLTAITGNSFGDPSDTGKNESITTKGFAIHDSTGILLAALVNAGNTEKARRKAEKRARARGQKSGTSYSYNVEMQAPVPGLANSFEYTVGSNDVFDYFHADARISIKDWDAFGGTMGWGLGFFQTKYEFNGIDVSAWSLPVSLGYSRVPFTNLRITGSVSLDPINPIVALGEDDPYMLAYETSMRVEYSIRSWFSLFSSAEYRQTPMKLGAIRTRDAYLRIGAILSYKRDLD